MIKEEEILELGLTRTTKQIWIWADSYYIEHIRSDYGYFLKATLHVPTKVWRNSKRAGIEDQMCKIMLHRFFDKNDPRKYWDDCINDGESIVVYKGFIDTKEHLSRLLNDTGII